MPLPASVADLIERFSRNLETYTQDSYNETQVRREFLDPLFQSLGWDMTNTAGYADAYKDVIHEDSLKIPGASGGTKAPDYCFRIGGTRKFFLEAKKPSVDIKSNGEPAYQLRRYAWSAKLPISVLSDFEEFAIYDTRIKPDQNDKASAARIFYCRYTDYPEKWDQIAAILSKDSILKGAFDKYAESNRSKRGTAQVDDAFLEEIEKWRDQLAANIALRNPDISERDLNVAVTKTIDRIVFLRICEDRGVEIYGQLQTITQTDDIYGELLKLFRRADEKYNSGLFHFSREPDRPEEPDTLTPSLEIDDKSLRPILDSLYYPESPYVFSVLPADILGHVYEQFLGKVIRLTPGHRAKVEEKPEVRKAGGVYYTPTYIVNYIVENTVGKLLGDATTADPPKKKQARHKDGSSSERIDDPHPALTAASNLKILDPACGSGSFLLGAYQYLLDWHLRYYASHNPEQYLKQKNPPIHQTTAKSENIAPGLPGVPATPTSNIAYKLTTTERKRILLNNIYGVDIDQNAVETTKLSLLLKVLEGESGESLANQMKLFRQRALPDLAANIKCGNSLIARDFYQGEQLSLIGDEKTLYRINAFNWSEEFATITKSGGFDAVLGNPPYVSFGLRNVGTLDEGESRYLRSKFSESAQYKLSLYAIFMQLGVDMCKQGGMHAFIVPDSFLLGQYFSEIRSHILRNCIIHSVTLAAYRVFPKCTIGASAVYVLEKCADASRRNENPVSARLAKGEPHFSGGAFAQSQYAQSYFGEQPLSRFRLFFSAAEKALVDKIEKVAGRPLSSHITLTSGLIGSGGKESITARGRMDRRYRPGLVSGEEIKRYAINYAGNFICFDKAKLKSGFKDSRYDEPKLLCRQTGDRLIWAYDKNNFLCLNNIHVGNFREPHPNRARHLLGVVNSALLNFYYAAVSLETGRAMAQTDIETLLLLPIADAREKQQAGLAGLVDSMLSLHQQLAKAKTGREQIQRQIAATDQQIDALVYELYELTPEEIQLVESATAPRKEPPAPADPT